MKLSEAMMIASTLKLASRKNRWDCCALGLSLHVAYGPPKTAKLFGHTFAIEDYGQSLERAWPWLMSGTPGMVLFGTCFMARISNMFEAGATLASIASYVARIEPSCGECNRFACTCEPVGADLVAAAELVEA